MLFLSAPVHTEPVSHFFYRSIRMDGVNKDIAILRELARQYLALCHTPDQSRRRKLWRQLNSLQTCEPAIYIRACGWEEMAESKCRCIDPFFREYENFFRSMLFQGTFGDDYIFEPWVTVNAVRIVPPEGIWGLPTGMIRPDQEKGAGIYNPPIRVPEDAGKMVACPHAIDEKDTARRLRTLTDAIGDLITINVDRGPVYQFWNGDISTQLASLRGLEQMMWDMMDRPEWLHGVLGFMRDGILASHEEAERAGDWRLCNHQNQAMPYAEELDDPQANSLPVPRNRLWCFCAAQETTQVGPEMFDEFMLRYQIPILEKFGLVAYGCCEDLTRKIPFLRRLRNLRRIAVSPFADVARCTEQIGRDYVVSYRPSPADMVSYGFDPDRIRKILRRDITACRETHFDITLKDVETVQGDPNRIRNWVRLARQVIDEIV